MLSKNKLLYFFETDLLDEPYTKEADAILGFYDLGIDVNKIAQALIVTEEKVTQEKKEYR